MVGMVAGTEEISARTVPPTEVSGWRCLICGYRS